MNVLNHALVISLSDGSVKMATPSVYLALNVWRVIALVLGTRIDLQLTLHFLILQLDDLNKQIAEERQEKQLIQKRFGDQHHEFERISRDKQELWEAKLRELQKDKYALQIRLQV